MDKISEATPILEPRVLRCPSLLTGPSQICFFLLNPTCRKSSASCSCHTIPIERGFMAISGVHSQLLDYLRLPKQNIPDSRLTLIPLNSIVLFARPVLISLLTQRRGCSLFLKAANYDQVVFDKRRAT